ncbi:hypothetical protein ACHAWC_005780, partial [Mediolabrus comicus]
MMPWNHPVTPSAASTNHEAMTTTGNDFMDFGSSVDIQDEMRRTIRAECDELDKTNSIIASNVKSEERTLHQLTKDYQCAKNEMASLRRDGGDILDEETMTDDIRRGFKEQFESEVLPHVTASHNEDDDAAAIISDDEGGNNNNNDGDGSSPHQQEHSSSSSSSGGRVYSHGKFLARKHAELNNKKIAMNAKSQEIKMGMKNIKAIDDETMKIHQSIESRGLESVMKQGERTIAQLQREVEVENQRNRGVKEAIQAARANSGVNAQTIAEKAKEQMTLRSEHLSKEAELSARNDALQQELSLIQSEEKKLDEELAMLSGQLDFFTQNVAEYEAQQKRSDEIKKEMECVKSDIVELTSKKAMVDKAREESSAVLKEVDMAYNEAKDAYDTIMSQKAEKEKARNETIKAAEARKANAMKQKEILAGKIAKCHEEGANKEGSDKASLSESEARLLAVSKKLNLRREELEKARAQSEMSKKEGASNLNAKKKQLKEIRELTSKFEAASKAEVDRLAELKKERIESRLEHIEKRRADLNLIEDAQKADITNIKRKFDVIQEVNKMKDLIAKSKIVLDKDGENDTFVMPDIDSIDF